MRFARMLCVFSVLSAASFQMNAQTFNAINFHLPYTVTAGGVQLAPGDYTIRPLSNTQDTFAIYKDNMKGEAIVRAVRIEKPQQPGETDVVLRDSGAGYALDEMWVAGDSGYQFLGKPLNTSHEAERKIAVIPATRAS
jgi:hypothetical protein